MSHHWSTLITSHLRGLIGKRILGMTIIISGAFVTLGTMVIMLGYEVPSPDSLRLSL
jgi:hypothetical protein